MVVVAVKKVDVEHKPFILMYSVLGHPYMLFEAFETRSGAISFLRQQKNVSRFAILHNEHLWDYKTVEEGLGW